MPLSPKCVLCHGGSIENPESEEIRAWGAEAWELRPV